jgi:hypothetical protein
MPNTNTNKEDETFDTIWSITTFVIGVFVGFVIGCMVVNSYWTDDAIQSDKAQHNPITGKVEWK